MTSPTRVRSRIGPASGDTDWQQIPGIAATSADGEDEIDLVAGGEVTDGDLERIFACIDRERGDELGVDAWRRGRA